MRSIRPAQVLTMFVFALALVYLGWLGYGALPPLFPTPTPSPTPVPVFEAERALALAQKQCDLGPRPSGTLANRQTGDWISQELEAQGWAVETHEFVWNGTPVRNIIAKAGETQGGGRVRPLGDAGTEGGGDAGTEGEGGTGAILVGAHYDTRLVADQDPDPNRQGEPVIGGNDGASGVAVLLELARVLDKGKLTSPVWLAFFDAEDNGRLPAWEQWGIGSTRLAEDWAAAGTLPAAMVLLDMIGDEEQRVPMEGNSDPTLSQAIFDLAAEMGYGEWFPPTPGPAMIDDHIAFVQQGVPSVDLIDFDYPYWHTTADTCDKLSGASLERVGNLLRRLLEEGRVEQALLGREQSTSE